MATPAEGERAIWRILDLLVKGLAAVLISGAITFYGIKSGERQAKTSEKNRQAEALVETIRSRETSAADMRAKMFGTLLEHYLKNPGNRGDVKVAILEMIGHNFEEDLNLKPLFLQLERELQATKPDQRMALRAAARNVKRDEIEKIIGAGGEACRLDLSVGDRTMGECVVPVEVMLLDVTDDQVGIRATPMEEERRSVTYYDLPLMNNRRLGELRYALVLEGTDAKRGKATMLLVRLPHADYGVETRLRSDLLLSELMKEAFAAGDSGATARSAAAVRP